MNFRIFADKTVKQQADISGFVWVGVNQIYAEELIFSALAGNAAENKVLLGEISSLKDELKKVCEPFSDSFAAVSEGKKALVEVAELKKQNSTLHSEFYLLLAIAKAGKETFNKYCKMFHINPDLSSQEKNLLESLPWLKKSEWYKE